MPLFSIFCEFQTQKATHVDTAGERFADRSSILLTSTSILNDYKHIMHIKKWINSFKRVYPFFICITLFITFLHTYTRNTKCRAKKSFWNIICRHFIISISFSIILIIRFNSIKIIHTLITFF